MMPANVKLSKNELALVCDEQFILTKNNIIEKVCQLFGLLSNSFTNTISESTDLPVEILSASPKIYKGEQYKGLPYVMLDNPRCFNKQDAFAIRCFFWWGNFFSITLHLEGGYKQLYKTTILKSLKENKQQNWYYCINETQWQHNFDETNYLAIDNNFELLNKESADNSFFKIAKKIPLKEWDNAFNFYDYSFKEILFLLNIK